MADSTLFSLELEDGRLSLRGELTRRTVMQALARFEQLTEGMSDWVVDCSGCDPVDSAAVAWLIELRKRSRIQRKPLRFEALPPAVLGIARMSQVEDLLAPAN